MDIGQLKKWTIFKDLEEDFAIEICKAWVLGPKGNQGSGAFVLMSDKQVFELGSNANGINPRLVESLSHADVEDISSGMHHFLALTKSGKVYAWGDNSHGQLGIGSTEETPCLIQGPMGQKVVTAIACGHSHNLALTNEGEVWAWGLNDHGQIGDDSTADAHAPKKITFDEKLQHAKILAIKVACGRDFSMVVLNSGKILSWGSNCYGQLGQGDNAKWAKIPKEVSSMSGHYIKKVMCGSSHSFALTKSGQLWAWGSNDNGQLGKGDTKRRNLPVRVAEQLGKIQDFAVFHDSDLSAAIGESTNTCFIWGKGKSQIVLEPFETPLASLHEAFSFYSDPQLHPFPLVVDSDSSSLKRAFKNALGNRDQSDVTFVIDGQEIHAHKSVLKICSEYFCTLFQDCWLDKRAEITQNSFPVFKAFLSYLYCGEMPALSTEDTIELLDLANAYMVPEVKRRCERGLLKEITAQNALRLFATACKYDLKELVDASHSFCFDHMPEVFRTETADEMDGNIYKTFIQKAARKGLLNLLQIH